MIITHQRYTRSDIEKEIQSSLKCNEFAPEFEKRETLAKKAERLFEKPQQVARAQVDEMIGIECVQSYVSNMSTATSLEELRQTEGYTLPENIICSSNVEWTAPRWAKAGDIVFFMHSKTARTTITRLRTELLQKKREFALSEFDRLMGYLEHALEIHAKYGGKIFAVGRICGGVEYVQPEDLINDVLHWKSRHYSAIDNIMVLDHPMDISVFCQYIHISRGGSITPLYCFSRHPLSASSRT